MPILVNSWPATSIQIASPDGILDIILTETIDGKVFRIDCYGSKPGTSLRAWTHSFCNILSLMLEKDAITLEDIVRETVSYTTDKSVLNIDAISRKMLVVRSGPEAIGLAIQSYLTDKFLENKLTESPIYGKNGEYLGYLIPKWDMEVDNNEEDEDEEDD